MARAYCCYKFDDDTRIDLPQNLQTEQQLPLLDDQGNQATAQTKLRYLGDSVNLNYEKSHILHESERDLWGRVYGQEFKQVIAINEFHMFSHKQKPHVLFDFKHQLVAQAVRRFKDAPGSIFPIQAWEFDLKALENALDGTVTGGWFGSLSIRNVQAAAVFGPEVSTSEDWQRLETLGQLRNITMDLEINGRILRCGLSQRGIVVIFKNLNESESLTIVDQVLDALATIESA